MFSATSRLRISSGLEGEVPSSRLVIALAMYGVYVPMLGMSAHQKKGVGSRGAEVQANRHVPNPNMLRRDGDILGYKNN